LGEREVAAGEDSGDVACDDAVVLAGIAAPLHGLYAHLECGPGIATSGVDVVGVLGRRVAVGQVQGFAFGCGDEVVCVHYYAVVFCEEAHLLCFEGAGRGLGQGYLLEGFLE
jgi:hypothetical protein